MSMLAILPHGYRAAKGCLKRGLLRITLTFTPKMFSAIDDLAKADGVCFGDAARRLIQESLDRHKSACKLTSVADVDKSPKHLHFRSE